jgi:hypothetical protein
LKLQASRWNVERKVCRQTAIGALPSCGFRLLIVLAETDHIRSKDEFYWISELYMLLPCYHHRAWTQDQVPDSYKSIPLQYCARARSYDLSMADKLNGIHVFVKAVALNADASKTSRLTVATRAERISRSQLPERSCRTLT